MRGVRFVGYAALAAGCLTLLVCPPAGVALLTSSWVVLQAAQGLPLAGAATVYMLTQQMGKGYLKGEGPCSPVWSPAGILVHELSPSLAGQQIHELTRVLKTRLGTFVSSIELVSLVHALEKYESWLFLAKREEGRGLVETAHAAMLAWIEHSKVIATTNEVEDSIRTVTAVVGREPPECTAQRDAAWTREKESFLAVQASAEALLHALKRLEPRGRKINVQIKDVSDPSQIPHGLPTA
jgi:hypothetical protein